jgi:hypothetical protein
MKQVLVYVMAVVGSSLLYHWSGKWEGKEWVFALLTLGVYAWSVQGWKRYSSNGFGLVFLTIFMLLNINPIFYLLLPPIISVFLGTSGTGTLSQQVCRRRDKVPVPVSQPIERSRFLMYRDSTFLFGFKLSLFLFYLPLTLLN